MTCRRTIFTLLPRAPCPARPFCRLRTERYFNLGWRQFKSLGLDAYSNDTTDSEQSRASFEHQLVMLLRPLLRRSCNWNSTWEFLRSRVTIFTHALEKDSYMRKTCIWILVASETVSDSTFSAYLLQNQFTSYTSAIERSNIKKLQTSHLFCRSLGFFPFEVQMINRSYASQGFGIPVDCRTGFMNFQGNLERIRCCTNVSFCISCKNPEKQKLEKRWPCFSEISG
jgi:hypothetical protein